MVNSIVAGFRGCRESDIVLFAPENTRLGSEDIARMDERVTTHADRIGYSFC